MDKRKFDDEFEESDDGAVDVVFLLIIFFLVTSTFTTEVKEKIALPPKRDATPPPEQKTPPPDDPPPVQQLKVVIFEDNTVWFNKTPVEFYDRVSDEETSIEFYYKMVEKINEMRYEAFDAEIEPEEGSGYPPMNIKVWSDKRAFAGMTFHAVMACLDAKKVPEIKFDEELNPDEILAEVTLENPEGL